MTVIKYGCQWGDWCSHSVLGPYGVSLWKTISKGWDRFLQFVSYKVGDGSSIQFWTDWWCGETPLSTRFLELYRIARHKDASVRDFLSYDGPSIHWDVCFTHGLRIGKWRLSQRLWSYFTRPTLHDSRLMLCPGTHLPAIFLRRKPSIMSFNLVLPKPSLGKLFGNPKPPRRRVFFLGQQRWGRC